jgi:hypothetical protein
VYLIFLRRLTFVGRKLVKTYQVSFKGISGSGRRLFRSPEKLLESNESRHAALARKKKIVQHVYNSWNKLWGYVAATPGRGYKEVMSQDGMHTGQAEVVAICEVNLLATEFYI